VSQQYPLLSFIFDSVRDGHGLPLWNPYQFAGQSTVANPQSTLFYPPAWIALLAKTPFIEGAGDSSDKTRTAQRSPSGQPATDAQTRALAALVSRSGSTCEGGVRAEKVEERAGIGSWHLECSGNLAYTVLIDAAGGTTVLRDK
jgi:hypothetical protein